MKLALAQIEVAPEDVSGNLERATDAVRIAADRGADLVVLPEVFTVGYFAFDAYAERAEPLGGPTHTRLRNLADELNVGLLSGSIVEDLAATRSTTDAYTPAPSGLANTAVLFGRDGERLATYRKHYLFGYGSREAELLVPGDRIETARFDGFTVGMTVCYDLRFPELYRTIAKAGADLILIPSAWPYPRVEHWQLLPRARALENLLYVAAVNGVGSFDDARLVGRSAVYDPWGTPIVATDDAPALRFADLSADRVSDIRTEFPAWDDRRDDM